MRGYLKQAATIQQCTRCFALRLPPIEPPDAECPSCRELIAQGILDGQPCRETRTLPCGEIEDDFAPLLNLFICDMVKEVRA